MKKIELCPKEKELFLDKLYKSFKNGYEFEDFLKPFLECIGLDEVTVTKRSGDGGIDLEGIRYGVINNNEDSVKYIVQAKRYKPSEKISVEVIDKLRGNMKPGDKGIIITTCHFSKPAIEKAYSRKDLPIVLIGGDTLIDICIENNIGFIYKPTFSEIELESFYKKEKDSTAEENNLYSEKVEKTITQNDIRARIISIPKPILMKLPTSRQIFDIVINGNLIQNVKISSDSRFFSRGISEIYRRYGLLTKDNVYISKKASWQYDGKTIYIDILEN